MLLSDGRLASCSKDHSIKIYNMNNDYHCDITIKEHTSDVNDICEINQGKLVSCSNDKSIKIWSIYKSSYHCEHTINKAHEGPVLKIISLSNNRIASFSYNTTIKIWNSNQPYNLLTVLKGHTHWVSSILNIKHKEILLSLSYDNIFLKWNLSTYQCESGISNVDCCGSYNLIELNKNRVIVGGYNAITIINFIKCFIEQIFQNNILYSNSLMILRDGNILLGCDKGVMYIYDIKLNIINIFDKKPHYNHIIRLLSVNEHLFIYCSRDKSIQVWEY